MEIDETSDFTCVDGECHEFKFLDSHCDKRKNVWILTIYFFCGKCLKEMANERKSMEKEKPVWWKPSGMVDKKRKGDRYPSLLNSVNQDSPNVSP